jgi:hypothetical protein
MACRLWMRLEAGEVRPVTVDVESSQSSRLCRLDIHYEEIDSLNAFALQQVVQRNRRHLYVSDFISAAGQHHRRASPVIQRVPAANTSTSLQRVLEASRRIVGRLVAGALRTRQCRACSARSLRRSRRGERYLN